MMPVGKSGYSDRLLADPPCESTGRTILDALVDALRALAPPPKKPSWVDKERYAGYAGGNRIKAIAETQGVSQKAVEKSLTIVRRWNEYSGLPVDHKGKRRRIRHGLDGMADAKALRPDELAED